MKRNDLTKDLYDRIVSSIREDVDIKINELIKFCWVGWPRVERSEPTPMAIKSVFRYASADKQMMWTSNSLKDAGYYPNEDIFEIIRTLFLPVLRQQQHTVIPAWFWDTALGYVCKVGQARLLLDTFMPLSVVDLALLADRKHTTVQQHCQRESIKAIKDGRAWKIPPHEALKYLKLVKSEPFLTHYGIAEYQSQLTEWLLSGAGAYINEEEKTKYYFEFICNLTSQVVKEDVISHR